jgi:hypothetical protein
LGFAVPAAAGRLPQADRKALDAIAKQNIMFGPGTYEAMSGRGHGLALHLVGFVAVEVHQPAKKPGGHDRNQP